MLVDGDADREPHQFPLAPKSRQQWTARANTERAPVVGRTNCQSSSCEPINNAPDESALVAVEGVGGSLADPEKALCPP